MWFSGNKTRRDMEDIQKTAENGQRASQTLMPARDEIGTEAAGTGLFNEIHPGVKPCPGDPDFDLVTFTDTRGAEIATVRVRRLGHEPSASVAVKKLVEDGAPAGKSLRGVRLGNVTIENARFTGTDLSESVMNNVTFRNCVFFRCRLTGASICGCRFMRCRFKGGEDDSLTVSGTSFDGCSVADSVIRKLGVRGSRFRNFDMHSSIVSDFTLADSTIEGGMFYSLSASEGSIVRSSLKPERISRLAMTAITLDNTEFRTGDSESLHITDVSVLNGADKIDIPYPMACPSHGEFTGWKIAVDAVPLSTGEALVELLIPADADRSSAFSSKCRASKAIVKGIWRLEGSPTRGGRRIMEPLQSAKSLFGGSMDGSRITYTVGETVYPGKFDPNRFAECSDGIHFFVDREEAMRY